MLQQQSFPNFSEVNWTVCLILRQEKKGPAREESAGTSGSRGAALSWSHTSEKLSQRQKAHQPHLLHLLWRRDQHQRVKGFHLFAWTAAWISWGFFWVFSHERGATISTYCVVSWWIFFLSLVFWVFVLMWMGQRMGWLIPWGDFMMFVSPIVCSFHILYMTGPSKVSPLKRICPSFNSALQTTYSRSENTACVVSPSLAYAFSGWLLSLAQQQCKFRILKNEMKIWEQEKRKGRGRTRKGEILEELCDILTFI